jgi:esterase
VSLFYREIGEGENIIILHGLMGMSDNWMHIARKLSKMHHVFLPDLPNHGYSSDDEVFSYESMLGAFLNWKKELGIEKATVIGHSMGGKLAMKLALEYPDFVEKLFILDISMRDYTSYGNQAELFDKILELELNSIKDRKELNEKIKQLIGDSRLEMLVQKNIKTTKGGYVWKMNPHLIRRNILNVYAEISSLSKYQGKTFVLRGELSDYVSDIDFEEINKSFPQAELITLKGAGHWLHVDCLDDFMKRINSSL